MSDLSEKLAAIEARLGARTGGPWWTPSRVSPAEVYSGTGSGDDFCIAEGMYKSDAALIANAPADLEFLLTLVREQAAKLAAVEEVAERYKGIALSGTPGTMETRTAAALAAGHIRIALEVKA